MSTLRKFKIDKKYYDILSITERKIVKILEGVVEKVDEIYKKQLKDGFYTKGVTKEEVESAAKKDPQIMSPFTYVSKVDGKLISTPYHKLYANELERIAEDINKAANLSDNPSFKKYLLARAKSLIDGSYREADIVWLGVKNSKIDFSIGPFERYLDKILFLKRVFQSHIGIINQEYTKLAEQYKEALYTSAKVSDSKLHSTQIPKKGVSISVQVTPAVSGYAADVIFSGEHFPSDTDLALEYGSKIIIYSTQLNFKFNKIYYPIFRSIFEKKFAKKYSKDLLLRATAWFILLYELGKQLHKFDGSRERLKELFGIIDEANGSASGIHHSKYLVVKGLISQDELEAIIIIHLVWIFSELKAYKEIKSIENYVVGDQIALNYYLNSGALKVQNGIYWPNFSRMFFQIEILADQLVNILQNNNYSYAKDFITKNSVILNLEDLIKNIQKLHLKV